MLELFNEISVFQADIIKSFAVFYLLLIGGQIQTGMFTCFQLNYIKSHKWIQLITGFMLFFFLVTLVSDTGKLEFTPPIEKMMYSVVYFLGFLLIMRVDLVITIIILMLIFVIYFIELNKSFYLEEGSKINDPLNQRIYNDNQYWITFTWPKKIRLFKVKKSDFTFINKFESLIYYIIGCLLVVGFISYGGEIKDTLIHSKNLTWMEVITDTDVCVIKNKKSFFHYLKIGLGVKL